MAFSTTTELAQYTEKELGHNLSGASSQRTDIVSHLARANELVHSGGGILNYSVDGRRLRDEVVFSFARALNPKILTLRPAITEIEVDATIGNTALTFDTAPDGANSIAGWFIRINNESEVYRISAHTAADTSATLDAGYVGSANVSAASCKIFKLHYEVGSSDILQLISPIRTYQSADDEGISVVDKDELVKRFPLCNTDQRFPEIAAVVKEDGGTVTLQMSSYPDALERIEIDHIPIPTTLDTSSNNPTMPARYRLILAHLAAYYMTVRNDDDRSGLHLQNARNAFSEMVEWNDRLMSSGDPDFGRIRITGFGNSPIVRVQRGYDLA